MPTSLSKFPRAQFYQDELLDGRTEHVHSNEVLHEFPWPDHRIPICFINVQGKEAQGASDGYYNLREAAIASKVVQHLLHMGLNPETIGLAVPYAQQLLKVKKALAERIPSRAVYDKLEVKSVDGYQGREKDLFLMLTTRTNHKGSIGFVADTRRICVGFTRATRGLIVLGNKDTLMNDPTWKTWLSHLKNLNEKLIIDSMELQQNLLPR